jgi:hypothetical protein
VIGRASRLAGLVLAAAAVLCGPARAADGPAWRPYHEADPITDADRQGAIWEDGEDAVLVVCTHQKGGGRRRFWVQVKTGAHLGRGGVRALTYRVGDEAPTTSRWEYFPRWAYPSWPMEDRHLVERIVDHKAETVVFRLAGQDRITHDVSVPVDAAARDLMAATLAACKG